MHPMTQQKFQFTDTDYVYEIGAFNDYLICIPHQPKDIDDYVEIHMYDCSGYEREIFEFLTKMTEGADNA